MFEKETTDGQKPEEKVGGSKEDFDFTPEKAIKRIDHLLNDYEEFPDDWFSDEEKLADAQPGTELWEKRQKYLHNKFVMGWPISVLGLLEISLELLPAENKEDLESKFNKLVEKIREDQANGANTKEGIDQANELLKEFKEAIESQEEK